MVGRLLVGFVCLNLQFYVSWLVDFYTTIQFSGRFLVGFVWLNLVFCVMVGRFLVGFVWLNLQFSVLWLVDFLWASCGSIFSLLCDVRQTISGVRVAIYIAQSFVFLCHGRQTFSGVRVAQSLVFCVMVGRLLVGFVWLNLQFSASWLGDLQWSSCGSISTFLSHGWQTFSGVRVAQYLDFCVMIGRLLVGFVWLYLQLSVSWLVDSQWGSCGSIFSFLYHGWKTFSGVRVSQCLVFCVMVGRILVGFVWLNVQFSVSWLVDFQWGSCGSIFSFLCHGWEILVGFVWLNLYFTVSWSVDFQWGSCGSIFSFLYHGWQTFSGVRVAQYLDFCVMVGRLLVGFVWLNVQFSVSWLVDFQWGSCGSIFSFLRHGWETFSGVRVAQSLLYCLMVGRLLVGFVWLNIQISVSWQVDFQWGSCGSIFRFLCHDWQTFSGVRVVQSLIFCHGWQTFSGIRVAQSLVLCFIVGRLLVGFVWLNLQFSVS